MQNLKIFFFEMCVLCLCVGVCLCVCVGVHVFAYEWNNTFSHHHVAMQSSQKHF